MLSTTLTTSNACHLQKRSYCANNPDIDITTDPGCFPSSTELNIQTTKNYL